MNAGSVLIVEDEKVLRDVYELVLTSKGHTVVTAADGAEGLSALKTTTPDIILLDVFMPVMDGREFMKKIKLTDYPDTKIVVYSNLADSKTETDMLAMGAEKFILKASMTPKDLLQLVDEMIA